MWKTHKLPWDIHGQEKRRIIAANVKIITVYDVLKSLCQIWTWLLGIKCKCSQSYSFEII